ncbi:MAG: hypothetical protein K6A93_12540 [Bacteroidaceae bacterium]|jgi:hypothetical protein|nr:hypothetical protein [Bacteroidaceae bacterium]
MQKILGIIEVVGLTLVVVAAALWAFPMENLRSLSLWGMSLGTVALVVGRFMQTPFYLKYPVTDPRELTLRRLYHQRVFGIVALILATVMMWLPVGFYAGMYLGKTSWLIPFVFFVVVEVYTVFRISAVEKG